MIGNVAAAFRRPHPDVHLRTTVGLTSSEVADEVREGADRGRPDRAAGSTTPGSTWRPAMDDELVWVLADAERIARPVRSRRSPIVPLILYDARWGWEDLTRRALFERAQRAGVQLQTAIEVEEVANALDLAARGLGDTIISRSISLRRGALPSALGVASFDPPLHETFAFIARRDAHLSPATRELIALAEKQLANMESRRAAASDG